MPASLDTLEMTLEQRASAEEMVRKMAYQRWLDAGCPVGRDCEFWHLAEQEWMQYKYAPHLATECALSGCAEASLQSPHANVG